MQIQASKPRVGFWPLCVGGAIFGAVTSQTVLDFFSVLMIFGIGYDFFKNKSEVIAKFKLLKIEWAILSYFAVITITLCWLRDVPGEEIRFQLAKFTWLPTLYIYIYAVSKLNLTNRNLLKYFSYAFLLPNIYVLITYLCQYDFLNGEPMSRATGLVHSATYHAHANAVVFVMFCAVLFFSFQKIEKKHRAIFLTTLFIFFLSIFLTMVRGIWLSIFFSTLLMTAVLNWRLALKFVAGVAFLFVLVFAASPNFRYRLNPENSTASSDERKNLIKLNWEIFTEYPVFGIGPGENRRRSREYWDRPEWKMPPGTIESHAHNEYLNVLSTTGILGFIFFISFIGFFVKKNWVLLQKQTNRSTLKYSLIFACMLAQIEFLMACLTDVTFDYAKIRALLLLVWALLICLERSDIHLKDESPSLQS